jgi:hypothetical protein
MSEMDPDLDWAKKLINRWIDDESELSVSAIRARHWRALPVASHINPMEAEWLAESAAPFGQMVGLSFEHEGIPSVQAISPSRDNIISYNSHHSYEYILLTSQNEDYIYFKDQDNSYFVLAGSDEFIGNVYKCSLDSVKMMYFDWAYDRFYSEAEQSEFKRRWAKYVGSDHEPEAGDDFRSI